MFRMDKNRRLSGKTAAERLSHSRSSKAGIGPATLEQVAGCLRWKGKAKTLRQMDAGIAKEVRRRHRLGRY
jgi:hypothetical protein